MVNRHALLLWHVDGDCSPGVRAPEIGYFDICLSAGECGKCGTTIVIEYTALQ